MRRTMEQCRFYLKRLNTALFVRGSSYHYEIGQRYGYKCIDKYEDNRLLDTVRCGLTTGELYDCLYAMADVATVL